MNVPHVQTESGGHLLQKLAKHSWLSLGMGLEALKGPFWFYDSNIMIFM